MGNDILEVLKDRDVGHYFLRIFLIFPLLPLSALAGGGAPILLSAVFPALSNIVYAAPQARTTPEYVHFHGTCMPSTSPSADCTAVGERFYDLSLNAPPSIEDTFDQLNRCIEMQAGRTTYLGVPTINPATRTVQCVPTDPSAVAYAHLALCYERASGPMCSYATVCFEGTKASGKCTRNYVAIEVAVPHGP